MHPYRAYYGEIFFEAFIQEQEAPAIIMYSGFPSSNAKQDKMQAFFKAGYHVFFPRYKGTYESDGTFLEENPVEEIKEFIEHVQEGNFTELFGMTKVEFSLNEINLFGASAAGAFVTGFAGAHPTIVNRVILQAPVWDYGWFNEPKYKEEMQEEVNFVKRAFKHLYRFSFTNMVDHLNQFKEIRFENYTQDLQSPLLVFHDRNDKVVPFLHSQRAKEQLGNKLILKTHDFGHSPSTEEFKTLIPEIVKFLSGNNH